LKSTKYDSTRQPRLKVEFYYQDCRCPVNRPAHSDTFEHLVIQRVVEVITMYKTISDHAAEITQDVIKARGEAINGEKELIETYLSDVAVTNLYKQIFRVLSD
jgi:hypothetical protein